MAWPTTKHTYRATSLLLEPPSTMRPTARSHGKVLYPKEETAMHITLTPAQHARLANGQHGKGLPQNFDPGQWADHPLNVPIYVTKGKGLGQR